MTDFTLISWPGLYAAYVLRQQNVPVTIVEAADYVGGRCKQVSSIELLMLETLQSLVPICVVFILYNKLSCFSSKADLTELSLLNDVGDGIYRV